LTNVKLFKDFHLKIAKFVSIIFYAIIIIFAIIQVLFRYVIGLSLPWSEELCRYAFIWLVFIGMVIAIRRGEHATIQLFISHLSDNCKRVFYIVTWLLVLVFAVVTGIYGFKMVQLAAIQKSSALGIPMSLVYLALPVGCLMTLVEIPVQIYKIMVAQKRQAGLREDEGGL
jgi:TRAP-type C4-dicarboxylate transport system permease small subunit